MKSAYLFSCLLCHELMLTFPLGRYCFSALSCFFNEQTGGLFLAFSTCTIAYVSGGEHDRMQKLVNTNSYFIHWQPSLTHTVQVWCITQSWKPPAPPPGDNQWVKHFLVCIIICFSIYVRGSLRPNESLSPCPHWTPTPQLFASMTVRAVHGLASK